MGKRREDPESDREMIRRDLSGMRRLLQMQLQLLEDLERLLDRHASSMEHATDGRKKTKKRSRKS